MNAKHKIQRVELQMDRCLAILRGRTTALELEVLATVEERDRLVEKILRLETRIEALETNAVTVHRPSTINRPG